MPLPPASSRRRGGRQIVSAPSHHATLDTPLHPIAEQAQRAMAEREKPNRKRRHVVVIQDGIKHRFETKKNDEEIAETFKRRVADAHHTGPNGDADDIDDVDDFDGMDDGLAPSRPGHADHGANPFEAAVARAVAEHLARLGLPSSMSPPAIHAPVRAASGRKRPVTRLLNHQRIAAEFVWKEPTDAGATLDSRIGRYLRFIKGKKLHPAYEGEHTRALRILRDVVGAKLTMELTLDDMDDVVDTIGALPEFWGKDPAYRDLKAPDAAAKARQLGAKTTMLTSQQRVVTMIRTFLIWLETRNEVNPGLLLGVRLFDPDRDFGGQRDWFDLNDLAKLFCPAHEARFTAPWQGWGLRIALFAGMRQREICQLLVSDIVEVDGIWCFDIAPDEATGKRVKNKRSRRKTPIHDELIKAGFLDYVAQARKAGVTLLFPDLARGKSGVTRKVTGWFSRYIRKTCGITSRTKTFHSLRHSFATLADRSELRDEHTMTLLGHSWGNTVLRRVYAQELDVREKHRQLHRIRFPDVPMTRHKDETHALYFRIAAADETRKARLDKAFAAAPKRRKA